MSERPFVRIACRDGGGHACDVEIGPWTDGTVRLDVNDRIGRGTAFLTDAERLALAHALAPEMAAVVGAAREYAESRRAWEDALAVATDAGMPVERWRTIERRQDAARAALLALFSDAAARSEAAGEKER